MLSAKPRGNRGFESVSKLPDHLQLKAMSKERAREAQQIITDALKPRGYAKQANLYALAVGSVVHMIDVQFSRWSPQDVDRFTLNCGVYVPGVTSIFRNTPEPKRAKLTDCAVSVRVGMLRPPHLDLWWDVGNADSNDDQARLQGDVRSIITDLALPFLGRFETERQIALFLTEDPTGGDKFVEPRATATRSVYAGILWRKVGENDRCTACLNEAMQQAMKTPLAARGFLIDRDRRNCGEWIGWAGHVDGTETREAGAAVAGGALVAEIAGAPVLREAQRAAA